MSNIRTCPPFCREEHASPGDEQFHLSMPFALVQDPRMGEELGVEVVRNDLPDGGVDGPYVQITWALQADGACDDSMSFETGMARLLADALIHHAGADKPGKPTKVCAYLDGFHIIVDWVPRRTTLDGVPVGPYVDVVYCAAGPSCRPRVIQLLPEDACDLGEGTLAACDAAEEQA